VSAVNAASDVITPLMTKIQDGFTNAKTIEIIESAWENLTKIQQVKLFIDLHTYAESTISKTISSLYRLTKNELKTTLLTLYSSTSKND